MRIFFSFIFLIIVVIAAIVGNKHYKKFKCKPSTVQKIQSDVSQTDGQTNIGALVIGSVWHPL